MASSAGERLTREEYQRKKQLEEARKAGTAPAEVDEEGHAINPHIPQYIAQAPWYLGASKPGLKHQRSSAPPSATQESDSVLGAPQPRGRVLGAAPTRFRKGACANCGSMGHDAKSCCERPRAVGAKWTGRDLKADEAPAPLSASGYAAKRDPWQGYDPANHSRLASFYDEVDKERRAAHKEQEDEKAKGDDGAGGEAKDGLVEGVGYNNAPIQKLDPKTRTTVRNLRLREDTAKYLRNLDPNSAYYDPKTRSMRDNPNPTADPLEADFLGDNFARMSGDARKFAEEQLHMFEAAERGQDTHMLGAPSQAELLHREFVTKKEALKEERRKAVVDRYGGEEHILPKEEADRVRFAQSEEYVEYSRAGKVIRGASDSRTARSRWEEDVLINNHTCVWGSWWTDGHWGYACCHSTLKNSFCTGEAGLRLAKALEEQANAADGEEEERQKRSLVDERAEAEARKSEGQKKAEAEAKASEEKAKSEARLKQAIAKEEKRAREDGSGDEGTTGRRKKYHSAEADTEVTPEQLEAFRMKRVHRDDPMKDFIGQ